MAGESVPHRLPHLSRGSSGDTSWVLVDTRPNRDRLLSHQPPQPADLEINYILLLTFRSGGKFKRNTYCNREDSKIAS